RGNLWGNNLQISQLVRPGTLVSLIQKAHIVTDGRQPRQVEMTIEELNDLIARGAAQPGIRQIEEMMRLSWALDEQARDLAMALATGSISTVASSSDVRWVRPASTPHADVG